MKITLLFFLILTFGSSFAIEGLSKGAKSPDLKVQSIDGSSINFSKLKLQTIVVFYRGSWCPYCIRQLESLQQEVMPKIGKKAQLIAISVDKEIVAKKMRRKFNFDFTVISDPKARTLKAFKIVNKLDDDLVKKYKSSYKIDVEGDSGEKHHMVAHPAVYIIENGIIKFADVNTDYKKRTSNEDILKALKN